LADGRPGDATERYSRALVRSFVMAFPRGNRLAACLGAAALISGLPLAQAYAATTTTTFTVTATVAAGCTVSATNLAFGTYSETQIDATSTITTNCSNGSPYNIGLNPGTATGATVTTRKMTGPASALLNYSLFSDSGRTTNWGNTVGTDTVPSTGTGAAQNFTVFGRLPGSQFVAIGAYTDTITVTVTF
jgi:spore coat protein U-like protein